MATFDPYHKWLGIAPAEQPPNDYRLLGLGLFESDSDAIDAAAEQRVAFLRQCATGTQVAASQKLLNEVAAARLRLLSRERKRDYDDGLRAAQTQAILREAAVPSVAIGSIEPADSPIGRSLLWRALTRWSTASTRSRQIIAAGMLLGAAVLLFGLLAPMPKSDESFRGNVAGQEREDNALKMKLCWCPPGSFTMGSPKSEPDRSTDEDQVPVSLTKGFWLGKFEVTQTEWQQVMGTTLPEQVAKRTMSSDDPRGEGARLPMYFVNHSEVQQFCRKLTEQEHLAGRLPKGWEFCLPTEAQWEYACRAGTTTATAFGNTLNSTQANFMGVAPYNEPGGGPSLYRVIDVGSYKPNAWGLCDMHGNVWEWCADHYLKAMPGGKDPIVNKESESADFARVHRGGGWLSVGDRCRSAFRLSSNPSHRLNFVGFRVAVVYAP